MAKAAASMGASTNPFDVISKAWAAGRPIVPLYGAGISIESGIPSTPELIKYFCRLEYLRNRLLPKVVDRSLVGTQRRLLGDRGLFVAHDWLDRFQLNADLLLLASDDALGLQDLFTSLSHTGPLSDIETEITLQHKLRSIDRISGFLRNLIRLENDSALWKRAVAHIRLEWHSFLNEATGGRQHRVDAFFDAIVRHKEPGRSHTYNSFISQYLDIRTTLTTNFDDLLENSLARHGLPAVAFEITKNAAIPPAELVNVNRAVIKLHGGIHGLRADESLSTELSQLETSQVCRFVPDDALILVLGYGGADRRVMALLEALTDRTARNVEREPRILWLHRGESAPPSLRELQARVRSRRIRAVRYQDAGLFLQELYGYLTSAHPVGPEPYSVLPQLPPPVPASADITTETDPTKMPALTLFHSDRRDMGTSLYLAHTADALKDSHHVIWIDLEEFPSVNVAATALYDSLCRHDSGLIPIVLCPVASADSGDGRVVSITHRMLVQQIIEGMRRGCYFIAFDSLGEFCSDQPHWHRKQEVRAFFAFLDEVSRQLDVPSRGDSRMAVAYSAASVASKLRPVFAEGLEELKLRRSAGSVAVTRRAYPFDKFKDDVLADENGFAGMGKVFQHASSFASYVDRHYRRLGSAKRGKQLRQILDLACLCRRPRSGIDLSNALRRSSRGKGNWMGMAQMRELLDKLVSTRLLMVREGGFYSMHRQLRDRLRELSRARLGDAGVADLHESIALAYYRDTFLHSRDMAVFLEYVYHRLGSTQVGDSKAKLGVSRYRALVETLDRERDYMFSSGYSELLLLWIEQIRCRLKRDAQCLSPGNGDIYDVYRIVLKKICDLEAEARREITDYDGCIRLRKGQIRDRLRDLRLRSDFDKNSRVKDLVKALSKPPVVRVANRRPEDYLRLLEHALDIGVCNKGLRKEPSARRWYACVIDNAKKFSQNCKVVHQRDAAHRLLIKTYYRLADLHLAGVDPWCVFPENRNTPTAKEARRKLNLAKKAINQGLNYLGVHPALSVKDAARLRCYYNTLRARCHYLLALFVAKPGSKDEQDAVENSARFLKRAEAALKRLPDSRGETALAVCELHRAESQLFQVKAWRERKDSRRRSLRKNMLNRASLSLSRAHKKLAATRKNVWWWTLLHLLTAQLYLELLRWSHGRDIRGSDGRPMEAEPWGFECLCAIASGQANILKDKRRWDRFQRILEDLKKAMRKLPKYRDPNVDFEAEWARLKMRAGFTASADAMGS